MHQAKTRLSELVELARRGERVTIARAGVPVADIVPYRDPVSRRPGGAWRGRARIAPDFDAPMPDVEELFGT